jgi:hypothetical protein
MKRIKSALNNLPFSRGLRGFHERYIEYLIDNKQAAITGKSFVYVLVKSDEQGRQMRSAFSTEW